MRISILFLCCLVLSSCGFSQLTEIKNQDTSAPTAKKCGECHGDQYAEWQETRHAAAYTSEVFKQQSDHYTDTDCLFCHAPGDMQNLEREPRNYNREEGITCVSCHLHNGSMLDSSKLCAVCHEETYDQWFLQQEGATVKFPSCNGCHGAPVTRTHTKGTNFFSNMLVAFEDEHEVRSHQLLLSDQINPESAPQVRLVTDQQNRITLTITNTLPHDLPTGSFGEKHIMLTVRRLQDDAVLATASSSLPATLASGESATISLPFIDSPQSNQLQIRLLRSRDSTETITLIHTYSFPEDDDAHAL